MATVLAFEPRQKAETHRRAPAEPGTILLFTGIRYERARPIDAEEAARRGNGPAGTWSRRPS